MAYRKSVLVLLLVAPSVAAVRAHSQEHKLQRSDLPAAVAATFDHESQGATIKGYATEREHGHKVYEAETLVNNHARDLQVAVDGTLNEVEEEVAMESLPASVQTSLKARTKGAQITKVESLTKAGKLVAYEAATRKGRHKGEIQVGPSGETLPHEE